MQRLYSVPGEVTCIERQDSAYLIHVHSGDQSCIVYFGPFDVMIHNQTLPLRVYRRRVGQQRQGRLHFADLLERRSGGEAKSVAGHRTRDDVPEFGNILQSHVDRLAGFQQSGNAFDRH